MNQPADFLYESLTWQELDIPSHAATGSIKLKVGEVGQGPITATVVAGVHGDEGPWGALAIKHFLARPLAQLQGRIRVVLNANPLAAEADARSSPLDHLDLNRSFPGDKQGSHTERLADCLAPLFRDSDIVIDLHGGGSWCVNSFVFAFPDAEDLAHCFDAPFLTRLTYRPGTMTGYAHEHGARAVAVEMGGRSRDELVWRDRISQGITRLLRQQGVLDVDVPPVDRLPQEVHRMQVLRPEQGGVLQPMVREEAIGSLVPKGQVLGRMLSLSDYAVVEDLLAPYEQTALLLLRPHITVLEGGAMTYVVAEPLPEVTS